MRFDRSGRIEIPEVGHYIFRQGKAWFVRHVTEQVQMSHGSGPPTVRIFLRSEN
jgi:hypothetical protein